MTASQTIHDSEDEFSTSHLLADDTEALSKPKAITPIPIVPLAALCLARLADPVNFSQILPYVNEYMIRLHITDDIDRVGLYSGIVESAFACSQLLTIFSWAKLSDRIGRKPVILAGIAGLAISTLNFGLGKSLGFVILFRCIGGLFSGHVAALHAVLAELSDDTNQHITFPLYGVFWPLGGVVGPLIGGSFSDPASRIEIFRTQFWREYPYFLPCLVTAAMSVLTVLINWAFLKETLASKQAKSIDDSLKASDEQNNQQPQTSYGTIKSPRTRAISDASASSSAHSDETAAIAKEPEQDTSARALLRIQAVRSLCYSGTALCMQGTAFDIGFVLFCFSPITSGGLGFSPPQIGTTLAISGCMSVALQILVMPHLIRRFHAGLLHDWCMRIWPLVFLSIPALNIIRKWELVDGEMLINQRPDTPVGPFLVIGMGIVLLLSKLGALAFSLSMLLVKIHSPSPQTLGSVNGLVQVSWCISRAVAPAFISTLFSVSTENHIWNGYFWAPAMAAICLIGCWASYPLRPKKGDN